VITVGARRRLRASNDVCLAATIGTLPEACPTGCGALTILSGDQMRGAAIVAST
jgi:hypothetical protein